MNKNTIVLFDIDYTLFDTKSLKDIVYEKYFQDIEKALFLENLKNLSEETPLKKRIRECLWKEVGSHLLYPETLEIIEEFSKKVLVGIFSKGHQKFQREKIKLIEKFFEEENTHIFLDKIAKLPEVLGKYANKRIFIVDDSLEVLIEAKSINPKVMTILVDREGKNFENNFKPDIVIKNLKELEKHKIEIYA